MTAFTLGALALAGALLLAMGWLGLVGKLPWDRWAAGAPLLIFGGVAVTSAALAFLPFSIAGKVSGGLAATVSVALAGIVLATTIASWLYGTRLVRSRPRGS
jgi:hypothetical protein